MVSKVYTKLRSRLYHGYFSGYALVKRHARNPFWRETGYAECANYAPYARGGGYIVSMDVAVYLARATDKLQRWKGEDASVGTWLAPLKLERRHDIGERSSLFFNVF